MRVLFVLDNLFGSTTTFIRSQIQIAQQFAPVEILSFTSEESFFCGVPVHSANYHELGKSAISQFLFWRLRKYRLLDLRMSKKTRKALDIVIRKVKPDIVHIQFGTNAAIFFKHLPHYSGETLIQFRGYDASSQLKSRAIYRANISDIVRRLNVHVASVSKSLVKNLLSNEVNVSNYYILRTPIDTKFFKPFRTGVIAPPKENKPTKKLVQVGSFRKKKGQLQMLRLFKDYSHRNPDKWTVEFYGEGETKVDCIQFVQENELEKSVAFHPFVGPSEVRKILNDADAFVHLAVTTEDGDMEGIPNAIAEAMAMELPVIATSHSGIPELITNPEEGFLIEICQPEFDAALDWAHGAGKLPKARKRVCEQFDKAQHKKALQVTYQKILNDSAK